MSNQAKSAAVIGIAFVTHTPSATEFYGRYQGTQIYRLFVCNIPKSLPRKSQPHWAELIEWGNTIDNNIFKYVRVYIYTVVAFIHLNSRTRGNLRIKGNNSFRKYYYCTETYSQNKRFTGLYRSYIKAGFPDANIFKYVINKIKIFAYLIPF